MRYVLSMDGMKLLLTGSDVFPPASNDFTSTVKVCVTPVPGTKMGFVLKMVGSTLEHVLSYTSKAIVK